jgi:chaperonin cofactor prefoldin
MPFLPCILCGEKLDQRTDKNGKFYFVCNPCGTQFFIRRTQGKEKLNELMHELEKQSLPLRQRAQTLYEIRAILSEIDGLKAEVERLEGQMGIIFIDEDKAQARKSLKTRIQGLLSELEKIAKRSGEIK